MRYVHQVCLVQRAGSLLLLLLPILHEAPLGAPCRLALRGKVVIKIEMQKNKHVHCIFILINRHGHIKSIFWLKAIHLRFGRRKSWLVPVQYLIGKRQNWSFNFQNTHQCSHFTDPLKFVICDDIGVRCRGYWIRQWHLGIAIFICLIPSLDVSFLITTYIGTITGIMMITVSQYVQIMLGDNPENPEVIFSNKLTDPW